jgi:hypothetical protein
MARYRVNSVVSAKTTHKIQVTSTVLLGVFAIPILFKENLIQHIRKLGTMFGRCSICERAKIWN